MANVQNTSSLYLLSGGKLIRKSATQSEPSSPKTIHYAHTIRMLNSSSCRCSEEIEKLKEKHRVDIQTKNQELSRLMAELEDKDSMLKVKDNELAKMRDELQAKQKKKTEGQRASSPQGKKGSEVSFKFVPSLQLKLPCQVDNPLIKRVKNEMKNTMQALQNITNKLQKPRRKYQFYNSCLENKNPQSQVNFISEPKDLNDSYIDMIEETRILQLPQSKVRDDDLDQTFQDESQDHIGFLERVMKQHVNLKQSLTDLEQSTRLQIQEMKSYYENEIQTYISMLSKQNEKDQFYNLNSTRTNIEGDSLDIDEDREAEEGGGEEEEEEEEYFEWGRDHKFEIIFPSDEVLEPDIVE